jgi:hypothetical protein
MDWDLETLCWCLKLKESKAWKFFEVSNQQWHEVQMGKSLGNRASSKVMFLDNPSNRVLPLESIVGNLGKISPL